MGNHMQISGVHLPALLEIHWSLFIFTWYYYFLELSRRHLYLILWSILTCLGRAVLWGPSAGNWWFLWSAFWIHLFLALDSWGFTLMWPCHDSKTKQTRRRCQNINFNFRTLICFESACFFDCGFRRVHFWESGRNFSQAPHTQTQVTASFLCEGHTTKQNVPQNEHQTSAWKTISFLCCVLLWPKKHLVKEKLIHLMPKVGEQPWTFSNSDSDVSGCNWGIGGRIASSWLLIVRLPNRTWVVHMAGRAACLCWTVSRVNMSILHQGVMFFILHKGKLCFVHQIKWRGGGDFAPTVEAFSTFHANAK